MGKWKMIEILIPTFNRSSDLVKNINLINGLVKTEGLDNKFRIIISNNASTDDTVVALEKLIPLLSIDLIVFNQEENVGLEKNAVFILEKAMSEYVVFLGDDDFLPAGYLTKLSEIAESKQYGVVIPGFSALMPDGLIKVGRRDFNSRSHEAGFKSLLDFSNFGHQLSGLFFKREGVVEAYKLDEKNRNIYLFIFFISYVMKKESSLYLPEYQVLVTQGNSKDWSYDDSGLLTQIFKNFNALYPHSVLNRSCLCLAMMNRQKWRMRFGTNPLVAFKSIFHLMRSKDVDLVFKLILPMVYPYFYTSLIINYIQRRIE